MSQLNTLRRECCEFERNIRVSGLVGAGDEGGEFDRSLDRATDLIDFVEQELSTIAKRVQIGR